MEYALLEIEGNKLPAIYMHGVELVWGALGQVKHMRAGAF